jgi:ubiquitin-protein ligase
MTPVYHPSVSSNGAVNFLLEKWWSLVSKVIRIVKLIMVFLDEPKNVSRNLGIARYTTMKHIMI